MNKKNTTTSSKKDSLDELLFKLAHKKIVPVSEEIHNSIIKTIENLNLENNISKKI